jgi:hypothetical protein
VNHINIIINPTQNTPISRSEKSERDLEGWSTELNNALGSWEKKPVPCGHAVRSDKKCFKFYAHKITCT